MADDRDTERRIKAWLDASAPDRLPVTLRSVVARETAGPSGSRYGTERHLASRRPPFGRLDRLVQVAAAVGIVAIVASTALIYGWSRQPAATGLTSAPASPSQAAVVATPTSSATVAPRSSAPIESRSAAPTPVPTYWQGLWAKAAFSPSSVVSSSRFSVHGLPGGGFVAFEPLGSNGDRVVRSEDGSTWSEAATIPASSAVGTFATSRDGSRFLVATGAAGTGGGPEIWYSDDLTHWTRATFDGVARGSVEKIATGDKGFVAIVGGAGASGTVWSSSDGAKWSRSTGIAAGDTPFEVISRDARFVLYASGTGRASVWTSGDGTTWTAASGAVPFGSSQATIVALGGGLIAYDAAAAGAGNGSSTTVAAWRSTDGIHWDGPATTDLPRPREASGLRFDSVAGRLLAIWPGGSTVKAWQSTDGTHWTSLAVPLPEGAALDVLDASFDDDGTTLVLSGTNTVHDSGQTAQSQPFVFALPVASLP